MNETTYHRIGWAWLLALSIGSTMGAAALLMGTDPVLGAGICACAIVAWCLYLASGIDADADARSPYDYDRHH